VQQAGTDVAATLHTSGVGIDSIVGTIGQADEFENFLDPRSKTDSAQPVQAAEEP